MIHNLLKKKNRSNEAKTLIQQKSLIIKKLFYLDNELKFSV